MNQINILLVEDNPDDVKLIEYALKKEGIKNQLYLAKDGEEAVEFLSKENGFKKSPSPELIILDLNLPKVSGFAVLDSVRKNPSLKTIPVIVLSTSRSDHDIMKSYSSYANCYISKPADLEEFSGVMKSIKDFWVSTAMLPTLKAS